MKRRLTVSAFTISAMLTIHSQPAFAEDPTFIACKFEGLPIMAIVIRGGMGALDNELYIGDQPPVELSVGSGLMLANAGSQEFVFSLRLPASVSISNQGSGGTSITYPGECSSTLRPR